ncbi:hypothetical protein ACFLZV_06085 [Candidatus Margulisiibacteriota bacterium]
MRNRNKNFHTSFRGKRTTVSRLDKSIHQRVLDKNITTKGSQFFKDLRDRFTKQSLYKEGKLAETGPERIEKKLVHNDKQLNICKAKLKKTMAKLEQIPNLKNAFPKVYLLLINMFLTNKNLNMKIERKRGVIKEPLKRLENSKKTGVNPYPKHSAAWFNFEINKMRNTYNIQEEYLCDKIIISINHKEFFAYPDPDSEYFVAKWMDVTEAKMNQANKSVQKLSIAGSNSPVELLLKYNWHLKQAEKHHAKVYKTKAGIAKVK